MSPFGQIARAFSNFLSAMMSDARDDLYGHVRRGNRAAASTHSAHRRARSHGAWLLPAGASATSLTTSSHAGATSRTAAERVAAYKPSKSPRAHAEAPHTAHVSGAHSLAVPTDLRYGNVQPATTRQADRAAYEVSCGLFVCVCAHCFVFELS